MPSITDQQIKLDLELVPTEKRLEIRKCNRRLNPRKKHREPTFQVVLDALALTLCYSAFLTTVDVLEVYMHHSGILSTSMIYPRVHDQNFDELPTDEDMVSFFKEQGHTREIKSLSGKTTGLEKLCLSRAQILWGMYHNKNVDYVELLWEDFTYQIANRGYKKQEKMYYPRFTKVIIHYFLTKDKTISKRNKIGMHTSRDDYLINTLIFISANEESQIYRARLPESMTSPEMRETAYKTYLGYAIGVTPPKKARKFKKPASPKLTTVSVTPKEPTRKSNRVKRPAKKSTNAPTIGVVIRDTHVMSLSKKKEKMTVEKCKGIELLSEVALTEKAQYEEVHKKSLRDFYKTHPSGSGIVTSAANIKPFVTNEGTNDNNNDHDSSSEGSDQKSDNGDDTTQSYKEKGSDSEHETDENETGSESDQEENEEEVEDDEEEKNDEFVKTMSNYTDDEDETNVESKVEDKAEVNTDEGFIQKEGTDAEMINVQQGNENLEITLNQVIEDAHVTISTVAKKTEVPVTSSSHLSDLASKFLNISDIPYTDAKISALEKEVDELKKDDLLNTQVTDLVDEHLDSRLGATRDEFMGYLFASITARITELSTYEAAALLTEFELKKILIDKIDESQSYLTATEHRECYDGLIKSYDLDKCLFSTYDKVYSLQRSRKDKDKDEDPSLDQSEEPKRKVASKRDWFTKPNQSKEPTDPDWNVGKTPQQGPTQSWLMTLASFIDKPSKTFDELMSTPIYFSAYIMNSLKITNLTQETLLGPAFKLLKGTRTNFAELEYDFEECYKALSEKLD
ncbi:hypothetical protein Tco_1071534 [Tanacetum coccineum]